MFRYQKKMCWVNEGDTLPNVGAECAAGVGGIVGALGEVAASGTLAMTSCKEFPLAGAHRENNGEMGDGAGASSQAWLAASPPGELKISIFQGKGTSFLKDPSLPSLSNL